MIQRLICFFFGHKPTTHLDYIWGNLPREHVKFTEIGLSRTYETMVFKAVKDKSAHENYKCCPWKMTSGELDMDGYNTATDAYQGHLAMCRKWARK